LYHSRCQADDADAGPLACPPFAIVYAALTLWIIVDLFRSEVLRYLWRIHG
jgi:hypothetical protein